MNFFASFLRQLLIKNLKETSINNNNKKLTKMDIKDKIDSIFEDKIIQDAMKESEVIFGENWTQLPSRCSKEEFYQQLPQAPAHAYAVAKICWGYEAKF